MAQFAAACQTLLNDTNNVDIVSSMCFGIHTESIFQTTVEASDNIASQLISDNVFRTAYLLQR
jgi:hypothetical protein